MHHQPRQRDYTLDHALVLANASFKELNMNFTLQEIGKAGELSSYLCKVNNHNLQLTFRGAGSGLNQEAKVKAIYEALEDSLLYQILTSGDDQLVYMLSTLSSPSTQFLQENELFPLLLKQEDFLKNTYPWLTLKKLNAEADVIYYPLSLLFPHTSHREEYNQYVNQDAIAKLANSTGIAMGATEQEALIHGINDWIERDAYGLFLLCTIMKKSKPARCILKQTLPDNIKKDIEAIESTYADELMIIDITSDFDIPVFFVSFTKQMVPVQPSGLGASLSKIDALQQALFEALQARDRYNSNTVAARQKTILHYQAYPVLLRAFLCDLVQLREEGGTYDIAWNAVTTHPVDVDLHKQMNLIMAKIKSRGCDMYYNYLFKTANGLTLAYVLLVGVETFGMMREGIFHPIKKRGLEMLQ
jgi:ribosomal protein S12 methylthiotransferase accessory factor